MFPTGHIHCRALCAEQREQLLTVLYSDSSCCKACISALRLAIWRLALSWLATTLFLILRARLAYLSVLRVSMKSRSEGEIQAIIKVRLWRKKWRRNMASVSSRWWWLFPCIQGLGRKNFLMNRFPHSALFFQVEISSHTPIPLFKPGSVHSGSAS